MGKKRKGKGRKKPPKPPIIDKSVINNNDKRELPKKKKWWQTVWAVIGAIILVLGGLATISPVKELFMSRHAKYEDENFDSGILNSVTLKPLNIKNIFLKYDTLEVGNRPVFNSIKIDTFPNIKGVKIKHGRGGQVFIILGTGVWMLGESELQKGIKIYNPVTTDECSKAQVSLILNNGRLYASAEFRDLKNGQIVGIMNYNHWKVYLKNLFDYRYADDRLEVLDKQGYVIFSILFSDKGQSSNGAVSISGYFMNPNSVLIVNTDPIPKVYTESTIKEALARRVCITKDSTGRWELEAEKVISKIKSVFDQ